MFTSLSPASVNKLFGVFHISFRFDPPPTLYKEVLAAAMQEFLGRLQLG